MYVGTIKPMFSIAAFCESIFEQEGTFYRQNGEQQIIQSFVPTKLTRDQVLLYEHPFQITEGQPVIYTYLVLSENIRMEVGSFKILYQKLLPLLEDESIDPVQALLISRFCKMHARTIELCKKANRIGSVHFYPDHFLPCSSSEPGLMHSLFMETRELVALAFPSKNRFSLEHFRDFIYIDNRRLYISSQAYDFDAIADFIDKEPGGSRLRQLLLHLFIHYNIIPCGEADPIFVAGQRNALWLAEIISIYKQAIILKDMGFPNPDKTTISLSYETTNKVYRLMEDEQVRPSAPIEKVQVIAQKAKYNFQA